MALRKKQKDISQEKQSILRTARGKNGLMSTGMIAIVVAIVFAVKGCSSKPQDGDTSSNSQTSQVTSDGSSAAGDGSSATETPVSSILLMRSIAPMRWVGFKVVAPP